MREVFVNLTPEALIQESICWKFPVVSKISHSTKSESNQRVRYILFPIFSEKRFWSMYSFADCSFK